MSFVSERTLEYTIVPKIQNILKLKYKKVIPIYFWASREGNSISEEVNSNEKFKVLAVYLRRPKISGTGIFFKINQSIINLSLEFKKFDIPVICALPLASNIINLDRENFMFHKIDLNNFTQETIISFATDFQNEFVFHPLAQGFVSLSDKELYELLDNSKIKDWNEIIERIKILRKQVTFNQDSYFYSRFTGGGYQPVYFLIQE